jgi:hypothetical protein
MPPRYICAKCEGNHPTEIHDQAIGNVENRDKEPRLIQVDQWEQDSVAHAPDIIETTGLGPCTGLIIYDPKNKKALVGHFISMEADFSLTEKKIETEFPDKKEALVWLGGITPEYDEEDFEAALAYDKERRDYAVKKIQELGFDSKNVVVNFSKDPNDITVMRIDTATGKVEYDVSEFE